MKSINLVLIFAATCLASCSKGNVAFNDGLSSASSALAEFPLNGNAVDDGLPFVPGKMTATWSLVSGPGPVNFKDASSLKTSATVKRLGTYVLKLTVTDGSLASSDEVTILVQ